MSGRATGRVGFVTAANVELARSIFAAWEDGDYRDSAKWMHPGVEVIFPDGPSPGTWRGLAGLAEGWRDFLSAWDEYRVEVEEFRELDDERVLVLTRRSGRGKTSGIELGQIGSSGAGLMHIREGLVTRAVFYFDREHALVDLGLTPEAGSAQS